MGGVIATDYKFHSLKTSGVHKMYLFTSESVSEGHPDKIADAISDAILDLTMFEGNTANRCACETLVTTNRVIIAGEYKGVLHEKAIESAIRGTVKKIGYEQSGFDWRTLEITNLMHGQSADIATGTDNFGAGDQGLMFGHAVNNVDTEFMPEAIYYSHYILRMLTNMRKNNLIKWLEPDSKSQVTIEYNDDGTVKRFDNIICVTQHKEDVSTENVRKTVEELILNTLPSKYFDNTTFRINPIRFVIGGPDGDTGVTGRKIIVDTYGGYAPHGGGAFSGKDPTKVDRSAAYMMRYLAKNIVASGRASWATIQISYAGAYKDPTGLRVQSDGDNRGLEKWIQENVDLTPKGIIDCFELFRPIYGKTTNYGHFGKPELPWEKLDLF